MSWWIYRTDKSGRRHIWLIDVDPLLILSLIGVLIGVIIPLFQLIVRNPMPFSIGSVGVIILGYACLVVAKISLFRRAIWSSWGPRRMSKTNARLYRAAYGLMASGGAMLLLIWKLTA